MPGYLAEWGMAALVIPDTIVWVAGDSASLGSSLPGSMTATNSHFPAAPFAGYGMSHGQGFISPEAFAPMAMQPGMMPGIPTDRIGMNFWPSWLRQSCWPLPSAAHRFTIWTLACCSGSHFCGMGQPNRGRTGHLVADMGCPMVANSIAKLSKLTLICKDGRCQEFEPLRHSQPVRHSAFPSMLGIYNASYNLTKQQLFEATQAIDMSSQASAPSGTFCCSAADEHFLESDFDKRYYGLSGA